MNEINHKDIKKSLGDLRRFLESENMRYVVINSYFQMIFETVENPSWRWWKFWVKKQIRKKSLLKGNKSN